MNTNKLRERLKQEIQSYETLVHTYVHDRLKFANLCELILDGWVGFQVELEITPTQPNSDYCFDMETLIDFFVGRVRGLL